MKNNITYRNKDIMSEDFIHIDSNFYISKLKLILNGPQISYVILSDAETGSFYLYKTSELLVDTEHIENDKKIKEFLHSHSYISTPAVNIYDYLLPGICPAIITKNGNLVGFYDREILFHRMKAGPKNLKLRGANFNYKTPGYRFDHISAPHLPAFFLNADFPQQTKIENTISVLINIIKKGAQNFSLPIAVNPGSKIDIIIQAKNCFEIIEKDQYAIIVTDDDETLPVLFKVRANSIGEGKLRLYAFLEGIALGFLDLTVTINPAGEVEQEEIGRIEEREPMVVSKTPAPDLQFLITEQTLYGGECSIMFRITASDSTLGLYLKPFGPIRIRKNPEKYFYDFFKEIEDLQLNNSGEKAMAVKRMEAKGLQLFEDLFPNDLRIILWQLKDKIKTVKIDSEEPWIPWELCKLSGTENGDIINGDFFCEAFEITRWIPGYKAPHHVLSLNKMALVVPKDSGLAYAKIEKEDIMALATESRSIEEISASYESVSSNLSKGKYSVWHFTGHGGFLNNVNYDRSVMILEDGEPFTPEDISGQIKNLGKAKPLIFLNACKIGRPAMGFTGIGGWASRFLSAGASGFIGAYWSIYDLPAYEFAMYFYKNLLSGLTVGKAALEARKSIKNSGDPTWLAYTVYADPNAKVES